MAPAVPSRPTRVGDMLAAAVPGLGERMLGTAIQRGWGAAVGADIARRSRPLDLKQGLLTVAVDNSAWLQELTLRAGELLAAVRSHHGQGVTSLRFALGQRPPGRPAPSHPRPSPTARLSAEEERSVEAIAAPLADAELAAAVRRLVAKDIVARRRSNPSPGREERTHA